MPGARDTAYEAYFLDAAERRAGLVGLGFPEQVTRRLAWAQDVHGDRWTGMPLGRLIHEIREEGIDAAAWAALASQAVLASGLDDDTSMEARLLLEEIAAYGARVEKVVRSLVELVAE